MESIRSRSFYKWHKSIRILILETGLQFLFFHIEVSVAFEEKEVS